MLKTVVSQDATRIRSIDSPVTCFAGNLDRNRVPMQEEIHNSPGMSKNGWKHSSQRLPGVADFPRHNNADIDQYVRMPKDPPPAHPKVETPLEQAKFNVYYSQVYKVIAAWLIWLLLPLSLSGCLFFFWDCWCYLLAVPHLLCSLLQMDSYLYREKFLIKNIINNLIHSSVYSYGSLVLINLYSVWLTFTV